MKTGKNYNVAFTAASSLVNEMHIITSLYRKYNDWDVVRKEIFKNRLLQTRTEATGQRYFRELKFRIAGLSEAQMDLIVNGSIDEQKQITWWSICKKYTFVKEFAIEVIRNKFVLLDYNITHIDYTHFFDEKSALDESLNELTDSTRKKLEQVVFRMLREASILDKKHRIIPVSLGKRVIEVLNSDKPESILVFPIPESELRGYL